MNKDLKSFLDEQYLVFNTPAFIKDDPIAVPHSFSKKEDIEIAGFITALLSWGQRKTILNKSFELMKLMEMEPYRFLLQASEKDFERFLLFKHRTFNGEDCITILSILKIIYQQKGGLEKIMLQGFEKGGAYEAIENLSTTFFQYSHLKRTEKHIARPSKGSAAKRINMFLRWMVRDDGRGVDFGLWTKILPNQLICPLDLHSGKIARHFGLLNRIHDDWKAATELTETLKEFDADDPVKYDFTLFGLGVNRAITVL